MEYYSRSRGYEHQLHGAGQDDQDGQTVSGGVTTLALCNPPVAHQQPTQLLMLQQQVAMQQQQVKMLQQQNTMLPQQNTLLLHNQAITLQLLQQAMGAGQGQVPGVAPGPSQQEEQQEHQQQHNAATDSGSGCHTLLSNQHRRRGMRACRRVKASLSYSPR